MLKQYGLLIRLVLGIILGIVVGMTGVEVLVRLLMTFSSLFGSFLSFVIPLIILAFITKGIADLGDKSRKLLGITVALSYGSTIVVGTIVYLVNSNLFPILLKGRTLTSVLKTSVEVSPYISLAMPPLMAVMTALILAFVLGIGMASFKSETLGNLFNEFHKIVATTISKGIIPLLPLYIAGVFSKMAYTGEVFGVMATFAKVFGVVIAFHIVFLVTVYTVAGILAKKNPLVLLKNMLPAYFTAIGTQSSAATIPVTSECIKSNGVKPEVAEFVASLCANIHLSGSMVTITSCSIAVMLMAEMPFNFLTMLEFIVILGMMMVAAPGLPGGAIMAAIGILQSNLGFNESMTALMIALYLTQDSFGTACNVTGDGAIAVIVDTFTKE